jgi:hypothetical protein
LFGFCITQILNTDVLKFEEKFRRQKVNLQYIDLSDFSIVSRRGRFIRGFLQLILTDHNMGYSLGLVDHVDKSQSW